MAELEFIAAQTSIMRIAVCWKAVDLVGGSWMVWDGIMGYGSTNQQVFPNPFIQ